MRRTTEFLQPASDIKLTTKPEVTSPTALIPPFIIGRESVTDTSELHSASTNLSSFDSPIKYGSKTYANVEEAAADVQTRQAPKNNGWQWAMNTFVRTMQDHPAVTTAIAVNSGQMKPEFILANIWQQGNEALCDIICSFLVLLKTKNNQDYEAGSICTLMNAMGAWISHSVSYLIKSKLTRDSNYPTGGLPSFITKTDPRFGTVPIQELDSFR